MASLKYWDNKGYCSEQVCLRVRSQTLKRSFCSLLVASQVWFYILFFDTLVTRCTKIQTSNVLEKKLQTFRPTLRVLEQNYLDLATKNKLELKRITAKGKGKSSFRSVGKHKGARAQLAAGRFSGLICSEDAVKSRGELCQQQVSCESLLSASDVVLTLGFRAHVKRCGLKQQSAQQTKGARSVDD